jgi:hypothetical protein
LSIYLLYIIRDSIGLPSSPLSFSRRPRRRQCQCHVYRSILRCAQYCAGDHLPHRQCKGIEPDDLVLEDIENRRQRDRECILVAVWMVAGCTSIHSSGKYDWNVDLFLPLRPLIAAAVATTVPFFPARGPPTSASAMSIDQYCVVRGIVLETVFRTASARVSSQTTLSSKISKIGVKGTGNAYWLLPDGCGVHEHTQRREV